MLYLFVYIDHGFDFIGEPKKVKEIVSIYVAVTGQDVTPAEGPTPRGDCQRWSGGFRKNGRGPLIEAHTVGFGHHCRAGVNFGGDAQHEFA